MASRLSSGVEERETGFGTVETYRDADIRFSHAERLKIILSIFAQHHIDLLSALPVRTASGQALSRYAGRSPEWIKGLCPQRVEGFEPRGNSLRLLGVCAAGDFEVGRFHARVRTGRPFELRMNRRYWPRLATDLQGR